MTDAVTPRRGLGPGLRLGRVGGVPVLLAPSWWLGAALITAFYAPLVIRLLPGVGVVTALVLAATMSVLLAISVLAHELGHCAVALRVGVPVRRVRLFLLGGISELAHRPGSPRDEGLIALAGPVVSLLLASVAGAGLVVVEPGGVGWLLVLEFAVANAAVAVFNLLPGLPLDGGRVLRAAVWSMTGRRATGTRAAVIGAGVVAVALLAWAVYGVLTGADGAWLRLAVCAVMAWFVAVGAGDEAAAENTSWPADVDPVTLVRPVLQLPAETPIADALVAAAGRGVVLVRADGTAAGLLDAVLARRLADDSPRSPAELAAEPIRPESVLFGAESGPDLLLRLRETANRQLLVVDDDGRPCGVLHRADVRRALAEPGGSEPGRNEPGGSEPGASR